MLSVDYQLTKSIPPIPSLKVSNTADLTVALAVAEPVTVSEQIYS